MHLSSTYLTYQKRINSHVYDIKIYGKKQLPYLISLKCDKYKPKINMFGNFSVLIGYIFHNFEWRVYILSSFDKCELDC